MSDCIERNYVILSTGSVIIFTGITSMIFLKRRLEWFRWAGMLTILAGLIITGLPDLLYEKETVSLHAIILICSRHG